MLFPTFDEVIQLHKKVIERTGGAHGLRDRGALEASLTQPQMSFGGEELYPTLAEKAAVLGYFIISNHPFLDGNKRIGYVVMETFLVINGYELLFDIDEQEAIILKVAAGDIEKDSFTAWVEARIVQLSP